MRNIDIRSKKRVAIEKVMVWLAKCKMWEFRNNELIREYLSARLAILETN